MRRMHATGGGKDIFYFFSFAVVACVFEIRRADAVRVNSRNREIIIYVF